MLISNNNNIIPTKVKYILDIFTYNIDFKVLIYTSYHSTIKKINIESYIIQKYKEYKNIKIITTILKINKALEIKNSKNFQLLKYN